MTAHAAKRRVTANSIPDKWREVLSYHGGIGSSKEWASALSMAYTTFLRHFPPAKYNYGSGITLKTEDDLEDFKDRVLTMRRLLGIKDKHVELPTSPKTKHYERAATAPWLKEHPELDLALRQARMAWRKKQ